jgi:hypothetical protein
MLKSNWRKHGRLEGKEGEGCKEKKEIERKEQGLLPYLTSSTELSEPQDSFPLSSLLSHWQSQFSVKIVSEAILDSFHFV